jgi:hypothetical protein
MSAASRLYGAIEACGTKRMLHWLHDYIGAEELRSPHYIAAPGLGGSSGIRGALSLAIAAH